MATASKSARAAARPAQPREPNFEWEGRDKAGKVVRGDMRAKSETVVTASLRRQGIVTTRVRKQRYRRGRKITEKDITLFTRQLATMMKAGVPLLRSFDIVAKGTDNPSVARLFTDIRNDVETGTSLSQAFRKHPLHFDALFCDLVGAGEQAGILDDLLDRLATYKEKMLAIKGKIKAALFYPAAVVAVAAIVVTVIMLFVIPAFKEVFANFGADLPALTLIVMAMSDFFVANWYILFGIIGGAIYSLLYFWKRSVKVQIVMDRLMLKLPILGNVVRKATIARWLSTLSTMFAAGVPLVEALDSVGGAAGNNVYLVATKAIQQEIATGTSLAMSMQGAGVFPNMVTQMASIGEESGSLDTMLSKAAEIYSREVDEAVESLSSLLEPLIMVILGTLIGGLVIAMYLPIFKMGEVV